VCAGRTDAGVHALGQVVSADVPDGSDPAALTSALNAMLGPSLAVTECTAAADDFHARFSARSRTYAYAILTAPVHDPWLVRTSLHHPSPLDLAAMNEAAGHLVGRHDFRSFGRVSEPGAPAERVLFELSCRRSGSLIRIRARANAFIHQMVRSLTGLLIQVGAGKRSPDEVPGVLAARDRARAGPVAPPHGLCLVSVEYDDGWSRPFDPLR
jgi:tRNA pseudouridine38-40 synthase